jgi:hypothetical protein
MPAFIRVKMKLNMNDDERFITKILDDGGPFVIWEKEKKGTFKRGVILDTWVCDNPDFIFTVSGTQFWVRDRYCINPGCSCKEITLSFAEFDQEQKPKELGVVSIVLKHFRVDGVQAVGASSEKLTQICQKFQKQAGVKRILKTRQKEMKIIGKEIVELSSIKRSQGRQSISQAGRKVGRNAPCPCGSGKKYKKCCLNK